jgi:hypothetical protein
MPGWPSQSRRSRCSGTHREHDRSEGRGAGALNAYPSIEETTMQHELRVSRKDAARGTRLWRQLRWRRARLLHAMDSLVLDYRYPRITAWVQRQYPAGYVKECPPWAMRSH